MSRRRSLLENRRNCIGRIINAFENLIRPLAIRPSGTRYTEPTVWPPFDSGRAALPFDIEPPCSARGIRPIEPHGGSGYRSSEDSLQLLDLIHCSQTVLPSKPALLKRTPPPIVRISIAPFMPMYVLCARLRKRFTFGIPGTSRRLSSCGGYIRPSVCHRSGAKNANGDRIRSCRDSWHSSLPWRGGRSACSWRGTQGSLSRV